MLLKMIIFFVMAMIAGWLGAEGLADEVARMLFQVISVILILTVILFVFGRTRTL